MEAESRSQAIALSALTTSQKAATLATVSCLWHYKRYFACTHGNSTHPTPTLNSREDISHHKISSHHECLQYCKKVSTPFPTPCFSSCPSRNETRDGT